jgi:hypothetical protein
MSTTTTTHDKYLRSAGTFTCKVEMPASGWLAEIGEKNTPCVQIPLVVCAGPMEGKRITYFAWLTPNAIERTLRTLYDCFQFNGDFEVLAKDPNGFAGFKCRLVTEMENYKGEIRCNTKWLNPIDREFAPSLDRSRAASLITRLGSRSKAFVRDLQHQQQQQPPAATVAVARGGHYEDDIPF